MKNALLLALANILSFCGLRRASIQIAEHLDNYTYYRGRFHRPESE